jgi:hypothetical protein
MEWSEVKSKKLKLVSAGVGASAVVAMGALGVTLGEAPSGTSTVSEGPEITLGETTTSTTAPLEPVTSIAVPPVTATPPEGFGMP